MYYEASFLIIKYCVVKGKVISFPETSIFFFNGSFKTKYLDMEIKFNVILLLYNFCINIFFWQEYY